MLDFLLLMFYCVNFFVCLLLFYNNDLDFKFFHIGDNNLNKDLLQYALEKVTACFK